MNLFKKIKKLFTNEVSLDTEPVEFITPYKTKKDKFKIGAKLIVPQNTTFMVCLKNKVVETIKEGEYQISSALMPNVANVLKLNKIDKYGKQQDCFYAQSYFIKNDCEILVNISNYRKLKFSQGYKSYFKVKFNGVVKCKVQNLNKFFNVLFKQIPNVKSDSAQFFIELILNEILTDKLDKATFSLQDYEDKSEPLMNYLSDTITSSLSCFGVELNEFDINFTTKTKEKKVKEPKKTKEEKVVEKQLGKEVLDKIEVIESSNDKEICMYDDEVEKKATNDKKFVDLSLEHLYDDSETKKCLKCGEINRKDALICFKCASKFEEE